MRDAISLSTLNKIIRDTLDIQLAPSYWVVAEIGELKSGPNGHAYLELLEKQGNQTIAKIRANIWAYTYRTIASSFEKATGQRLQASMKILASVTVTFHEVYGMSLNIKDIDPIFTLGERAKLRQATINRLLQEGLMDLNKQLALPGVPQKIAVISSPHAAGYEDFVKQLSHNSYGYKVHTTLFPAIMQGSEAANSIVAAIRQALATANHDALIIVRGGGSTLDLECFDDYTLAKTLATAHIPVLTGIGHERDESIADLVAHTKLKTPTAVAEFLLAGFLAFEEDLLHLQKRMDRVIGIQIQSADKQLHQLQLRLQTFAKQALRQSNEHIHHLNYKIKSWSQQSLKIHTMSMQENQASLIKAWDRLLEQEHKKVLQLEKDITRLDPWEHFKRGYTRSEINGLPLHRSLPQIGSELTTFTSDKKISSTIQQIEGYE
jgi:exodeoxyribonuclease VII large subunit